MIVEHAIYKYFKNRKERKNSPAQSNNKEKGDVRKFWDYGCWFN